MRNYKDITKPTPVQYCSYCGMKMERKRFASGRLEDLGSFKRRKYCNMECARKSFVKTDGNKQLYGPAHHSARKITYLLENKEKKCVLCGSTNKIDVHHKDGDFHNNSVENLIVVCRSCHLKLHRQKSECVICGKPVKGHGYCEKHYQRWKRYGDPCHAPWSTYHRKMFVEKGPDIKKGEAEQLSLF